MDQAPAKETTVAQPRKCSGEDCPNDAGALQCPTCQKIGKESYFCGQECFKRNWSTHKTAHKAQNSMLANLNLTRPNMVSYPDADGHFNPFPAYPFTGSLRPVYPLSPRRTVPDRVGKPDYAGNGIPASEQSNHEEMLIEEQTFAAKRKITILNKKEQDAMRKVCRFGREVLDIAAREIKPGVTTDHIDKIVHEACMERDSYPSPLNYCHFPKSLCTSPNEVICHGIPDHRPLQDGDILNLDISLYHEGFHADLNETYYVGPLASQNPDNVRVVETARECLDEAIKLVKPGALFRDYGPVIEKVAKAKGCQVVKTYCGHGVNRLFHGAPSVPHYAKNKAVGEAAPGMCFTIEPMITLGSYRDKTWPDDWTSVTADGKRTAQFEHTLLVTEKGVEVLTARVEESPGGRVEIPKAVETSKDVKTNGDGEANGETNGAK
ncbi:Methionine aminopeptidase 1 [Friedmanniomyces endolithicus]|uniref:Methionine aminopeptidase n=1 Tax=Friedmanniomyces endolithicus TaxID=329885 RepID=A0AAN6KWI6_9PEZI|nr:Methionine aminopeptidase 1 [Friedmanniomyces endolithicus]KAK0776731.1 Methionine aminopeptidase 1 [Friedmanniomyces endolithicus]KAK0779099.1 Methionine aminopeptidase 1 [Friedmanniomyces endolithicus]KAK0784866.1 Methionine aminopeptidase 1 [Friedmanniomyces endolithicus]KAK0843034.1 Methionine aminopeptidase 1 [Friedmanniomyces endolithicus]